MTFDGTSIFGEGSLQQVAIQPARTRDREGETVSRKHFIVRRTPGSTEAQSHDEVTMATSHPDLREPVVTRVGSIAHPHIQNRAGSFASSRETAHSDAPA